MVEINTIYNEDCLKTMARLPDKCIDMVITSPPYDKLRTYTGYVFSFEKIADELYRIIKDGGVIVWVVGDSTVKGDESGTSFTQALYFKELGFNLNDTMIFSKLNPFPTDNRYRYQQSFEYMFVFSKGYPKNFTPVCVESKGRPYQRRYKTDGNNIKNVGRFSKAKKMRVKKNIWSYRWDYHMYNIHRH